jgi:hypothetical protein
MPGRGRQESRDRFEAGFGSEKTAINPTSYK